LIQLFLYNKINSTKNFGKFTGFRHNNFFTGINFRIHNCFGNYDITTGKDFTVFNETCSQLPICFNETGSFPYYSIVYSQVSC
ncbi:MAG: hypothetical protein PF518_09425, partial [Spirochaetaceae bacterium]|nr:hypothetical protein [Spirochaetaceae bacterium]